MNEHNKFIVRRTDSQERFEVLWKKRMEGNPTLKELAEMDEIINRDPLVHEFVMHELEGWDTPPNNGPQNMQPPAGSVFKRVIAKIRSLLKRGLLFFITEPGLAVN